MKHEIQGHIMNVLCVPAAFPPKPYGTNMYIIWCKDTRNAVIEEQLLFSGDTFYRGLIGNFTLTTGQAERMWPSLDKISTLPPDTVVLAGHGPSTTIKDEPWLSEAKKKGVIHEYN